MKVVVLLVAAAAIALGAYDLANPYRGGMFGYDYRTLNNGDQVVTRIYPASPVERAGLKTGDVMLWSVASSAVTFQGSYPRVNQPFSLPVWHNGKRLQVKIVTASYKGVEPIEEGPSALIVLLAFAGTGILVALRGAERKTTHWLAFFLTGYSSWMALTWYTDVAPATALAFAGSVLASASSWVINYFLLLLVAHFPPIASPIRIAIMRLALPLVTLVAAIQLWTYSLDFGTSWQLLQIAGSPASAWLANLVWAIISALLLAGALEGLLRVDDEHRAQMRWVSGAVILSQSGWLIANITLLVNPNPQPWTPWMSLFQDIPLLAIAYAILRHRLVDISIVFSRAAVFGFVSITLVTLFIAGEWVAAQILERGLGAQVANGWLGKAAQIAVALGVGLSARSIHGGVEKRLNALFFGRRAKALAALRRLALEADVVTDIGSLLTLTQQSLEENTEAIYCAIYMIESGNYERERTSDDDLPHSLPQNDAAIVRLRRWNEAFEMDRGDHALSEALLLPMTVRGRLLGLIACGPKRERTHYLSEETDALELVAHRVGTAYELLSRERPEPEIDLASLRQIVRAEIQALSVQPT